MRLLNLFYIHLKLFLHKNIRNYTLFLAEIILSVIFLSSFITTIFYEFNYKINYLNPKQYNNYAVLSVHSSISNNMFLQETTDMYRDLISSIENIPSVLSTGFSSDKKIELNGLSVTHITYTSSIDSFRHATTYGNWLSANHNYCILGGNLSNLYNIGESCYIDNIEYQVIDYLTSPYFLIDSGIGGSLNITNVLKNSGDVILTIESSELESIYGSLLIKYDPTTSSFESLKKDLSEFGTLYSITDLINNAKHTRNAMVFDNLPIILSMMLICVLIATSGLLIAAENNKKNHAILLLVGERKLQLISFIIASQCTLLLIGWNVGTILSNHFCYILFGIDTILPEAKIFTALVLSSIFIINAIIILFVYKKSSITTYRNNS